VVCSSCFVLQALAESFQAKRKAGLVQGHGSGYGGSGYKFDKSEDAKIKAARKSKAKVRVVVWRYGKCCCCVHVGVTVNQDGLVVCMTVWRCSGFIMQAAVVAFLKCGDQ
jgi:hypothetical protein